VLWFKERLVKALSLERCNIGQSNREALKYAVMTKPEAISLGLRKISSTHLFNEIFSGKTNHLSIHRDLTGLEQNSYLELMDLFL